MKLTRRELEDLLNHKVSMYESPRFIDSDPIQIPKRFTRKEDIEIAGFLTAVIAWGNRKSIINSGNKMMALLSEAPYDFVLHHRDRDLIKFRSFVHRTFNSDDLVTFIKGLRHIYLNYGGPESFFKNTRENVFEDIVRFRTAFFEVPHDYRTRKHFSNPSKGSAAKRINMFLRWMARDSAHGVDFGLWNHPSPAALMIPLDVHTATTARKLGLLSRKQNDRKAVEELTANLKCFCPQDPVKYDFALFGMGVFEKDLWNV